MSEAIKRLLAVVESISASSRKVGHPALSPAQLEELRSATTEVAGVEPAPSSPAIIAELATAASELVWLGHGWGPRPR